MLTTSVLGTKVDPLESASGLRPTSRVRPRADQRFVRLNRIEGHFQALRYFALDGTDHRSHDEQNWMIRRYIRWRNRNAHDQTLRQIVNCATLPDAELARCTRRSPGHGRESEDARTPGCSGSINQAEAVSLSFRCSDGHVSGNDVSLGAGTSSVANWP